MKFKTHKKKIGVLGLREAGKTVFITSLISQIENSIEAEGRVFKDITAYVPWDNNTFEYKQYRDAFSHQEWPEKTKEKTSFKCSFEYKKWKYKDVNLELIDLPGERISDYLMLANTNFDDWSDAILSDLSIPRKVREHYSKYINYCSNGKVNESTIIMNYKELLYHFADNYITSSISPSTFNLDQEGKPIKRCKDINSLLNRRYVGIDAENQFAPIPKSVITKINEKHKKKSRKEKKTCADYQLLKLFRKRYELYRDKIVIPTFKDIAHCDTIVVLVDIPDILSSGYHKYNDIQRYVQHLVKCLNPQSPMYRALRIFSSKISSRISTIAFIAVKADLVRIGDIGNLKELLKKCIKNKMSVIQNVKQHYFVVSSATATMPVENNPNILVGNPTKAMKDGEPITRDKNDKNIGFEVPQIDNQWPEDNWAVENYVYPELFPFISRREDAPLNHINIDKVFELFLEK